MEDDTKKLNYINKLNEDDEFIVVDEKATIQKVSFKDFKKNLKLSASTVIGDKGEKGNVGDYGDYGDVGEKGIKGLPGQRGIAGDKGRTGQVGNLGEMGQFGLKGDNGDKGESGIKGETGNRGFQGKTGNKGQTGDKGNAGAFGLRGDSGQTPVLEAEKGQKGEPGEDAVFGKRGERGQSGQRGEKGAKGRTGSRGANGKPVGELTHALYGSLAVRNWIDLNITSGNYVHLSYFKNNNSASYKYFKLILEIPDNDNILTPTNDLVLNLMIPGAVTDFKPVISGLPPIIWIKDETDVNYTTLNRSVNRVPRVVTLGYHSDKSQLGVYIATKNATYISESKIHLKIKKMFGTNDI